MIELSDEEVLRRLVKGDRFLGRMCFECTHHPAAFIVRGKMVGVCHRCGHLAQEYEVRYPKPEPGESVSYPHCYACYLVWRAGKGR
ncbi:MAG: hypothetical protein R6T96_03955 [Longimicrobiales bacterium]